MPTINLVSVPSGAMLPDESPYMYFVFQDTANPMYDENFQPRLLPDGTPEPFTIYAYAAIPDGMQATAENIEVLELQALETAKEIAGNRAKGIQRTQAFRPLLNDFAEGEPQQMFNGEV